MSKYLFLLSGFMFLVACTSESSSEQVKKTAQTIRISGKTMGSGYNITYIDSLASDYKPQIEQLLQTFNQKLSTYDSTSLLSQLNKLPTMRISAKEQYLITCIEIAKKIHKNTDGFFNPAIKPLVNYWGFGYKEKRPISNADPKEIDSLLRLTDFDKVELIWSAARDSVTINKTVAGAQLEFNAMAPGYAADLIAELLESKNVHNYLIEVGGEILAKGALANGKFWRVGINTPTEGAAYDDFQAVVELRDIALATSGNYRSFYEAGGKKYVHTINPKTGYTEQNTLLSASVFAPTCAEADAFATACMAMGIDKAVTMLEKQPTISAYFIYVDAQGNPQERWINKAKNYFLE
jgi:FAD:protein FMN transferase